MSASFPAVKDAVYLDQCAAGTIIRFGTNGHLGVLWQSTAVEQDHATHLIDLDDFHVKR